MSSDYLIADDCVDFLIFFDYDDISKGLGEAWGVVILVQYLDSQLDLLDVYMTWDSIICSQHFSTWHNISQSWIECLEQEQSHLPQQI